MHATNVRILLHRIEQHNALDVDVQPGDRHALTYVPGFHATLLGYQDGKEGMVSHYRLVKTQGGGCL
jgi:hypothetical protein